MSTDLRLEGPAPRRPLVFGARGPALPLLLALAWLGGGDAATAADKWIEVKGPNFTVVSNAGEKTTRRAVRELEQVRAAYVKIWPWAHLTEGKPMVVLALKNKSTLKRWAPAYFEVKGGIEVSSGSAHGADRVYLLLRTDYRPDNVEVTPAFNMYRAYVMLLLSASLERRLPLWLSNGLGEVLGNTIVKSDEILIGSPVPWEFKRFNTEGRLPLQTILDARRESPLLNQRAERRTFDAQSYVLVHYLMFGDQGAHSEQLRLFTQLWLQGRSHDVAFAEAFGDVKAIEGKLVSYGTTRILTFGRLKTETSIDSEQLVTRALAPVEVAGLQAAVHVAKGRPVEAQAAIRDAREADPRSPVSYDAEGLLADRDRDEPRARQAYARAVELGSTNAYSHYRGAQLTWKPQADEATLASVRQRLERAIELNGSFANSYSFLAEVLVRLGDGEAGLVAAERAVALEPGETYHRVALARVLHDQGRDEEARRSAELGLQLADSDAERSNAERFILYLDQKLQYAQEQTRRETFQAQTQACEAGDSAACALVVPELEKLCAEGQARTCMYLGWLFSQGSGLEKDPGRAARYLAKACGAGDKRACVEHAWKLIGGDGIPKDEAAGAAALQSLCDEDYYAACTRLALSEVGKADAEARSRAKVLLTRACEGGEQDACSMIEQF